MPTYDLKRGDKTATVESPRELTPTELASVADQHFGAAGEPEGPGGTTFDPFRQPGTGALSRLGALGGAILNPKNAAEHGVSLAATWPLFGLGGKLGAAAAKAADVGPLAAKVAPSIGRMATGAAQAGAGSAARGESGGSVSGHAALGAGVTAGTEGLLTAASKPFAQRGFEQAKSLIARAMDAIKGRLTVHPLAAEALVTMPSFGGSPIPVTEAARRLSELRGPEFQAVAEELRHALNAIDANPRATMKAGDAFLARLAKDDSGAPALFEPLSPTRRALTGESARRAADTLTAQPIGGIPAGAFVPIAAASSPASLARHALQFFR